MRYLSELDNAGGFTYTTFARTRDYIWTESRDAVNRLGERWSGQNPNRNPNVRDWRTSASVPSAQAWVRHLNQDMIR